MSARMDINFFDPAVVVDPYPVYEEIRAAGRAVWNDLMKAWMVPGYDDCMGVLSDPARYSTAVYRDPEKVWWFEASNMVSVDPPEQHRLRGPMMPMFTRSAVARWESRVREVVDELLAPLFEKHDDFDIVKDFTMIPTVVLARMIGVPDERHEDFRRWSRTVAGGVAYGWEDPETRERMRRATDELRVYLLEEMERHRREKPDDVLTAMLTLPPDVALSDAEIRSTITVLLLAGYDTTAKLLGNALVVLEQHPDQRQMVAEDPALVPVMIEEVLRWCGVLHGVLRTAEEDTEIGGTAVAKGQLVCTLPAAANRDPDRWPDPLTFDLIRDQKAHLGFGYGPHLCIGAPLARLEAKVAMERLLAVAPIYRLREVDYGHAWFIRGPERGVLDVGVHAGM